MLELSLERVSRSTSVLLQNARDGLSDLISGVGAWRVWHILGSAELRRRYARSPIGQFWLTISTGIILAAIGSVWSGLFKMELAELMPYAAVSYVLWLYISGVLSEMTLAFVGYGTYFLNQRMSMAAVVYSIVYRNLLALAHNSVIVALTFLYYSRPVGWGALAGIIGLLMITVFCVLLGYVVGIVCTRFRDLVHIIANVLQVGFFITPLLWKKELLAADHAWVVDWNPIAHLIALVREPLLGHSIDSSEWGLCTILLVVTALVALPVIGRTHRQIVYWL